MIQTSKIYREINRIGVQIKGLPDYWMGQARRISYDRVGSAGNTITEGRKPVSADMAILLVYQPRGLLESLFLQLEHLLSKGLGVVIVSNRKVLEHDRNRLSEYCHLIIERKNIGYDFGGYRDGILALHKRSIHPKSLFVMNDSVWFPIRKDCDLIDRCRESRSDIVGVFYNNKSKFRKNHHLQSYFYRFGEKVVSDSRFIAYWRKMPMYNDKRNVIRNLELKLTKIFQSMGFGINALYAPEDILKAFENIEVRNIWPVLDYYISALGYDQNTFWSAYNNELPKGGDTHALPIDAPNSRVFFHFLDAHPEILIHKLNSPIIKKNRDKRFVAQRRAIIEGGFLKEIDAVIQKELINWDR
ncbi:rhamnan synthesis F family protein [Sinorhizobium fredii]|nr:rhamnan synthesis F family protein [Sinorhizobium fredii]